MGIRGLQSLIEQSAVDSQLSQLDSQISQANLELKKLKSTPGSTVSGLEKQLSGIYKQIEDTKKQQMDAEDIAYYEELVNQAKTILDKIWKLSNEEGLMEQDTVETLTDPNKSLKDQTKSLKDQIVSMRKQEKEAKQNFMDQKKLKNKQGELEDITKEKEKYQKYSTEKEAKVTSSLNTRIDNATKALTNIQGKSGQETDGVTEQAEQQLTPKQEKEKKSLERLIKSLTNELNGISRRMSKYTVVTEDTMSGMQGVLQQYRCV